VTNGKQMEQLSHGAKQPHQEYFITIDHKSELYKVWCGVTENQIVGVRLSVAETPTYATVLLIYLLTNLLAYLYLCNQSTHSAPLSTPKIVRVQFLCVIWQSTDRRIDRRQNAIKWDVVISDTEKSTTWFFDENEKKNLSPEKQQLAGNKNF